MSAIRWLLRAFFARIGWVAAGLLLVLLGFDAKAQGGFPALSCPAGQQPRWISTPGSSHCYRTPQGTVVSSPQDLKRGCTDAGGFVHSIGSITQVSASGAGTASGTYRGQGVYTFSGGPNNSPPTSPGTVTGFDASGSCVAVSCSLPSGTKFRISAPGAIDGTFCFSNCSVTTDYGAPVIDISETKTRFGVVSSGNTCSGNNPDAQGTDSEGTVTDGTDTLKGFDQTGQQCGYVNGEYVCLATIPPGACTLTPGKTAVCSPGATTPNAPDNGTPGQTATPNATITNNGGQGNTYNVYNSSTVNSSTNLGNGDPDGDGSDSSGECDPGDTQCGEGGRGDGRVGGPGGTAKTFGASVGTLYNAVRASPIGSSITSIASGMPTGGTCPVLGFNAPIIGNISTDIHCGIWSTNIAPILRAVFLAIWALVGLRIIFEG